MQFTLQSGLDWRVPGGNSDDDDITIAGVFAYPDT